MAVGLRSGEPSTTRKDSSALEVRAVKVAGSVVAGALTTREVPSCVSVASTPARASRARTTPAAVAKALGDG